MRSIIFGAAAGAALATFAGASNAQERSLSITIYTNGQALVEDVRALPFQDGRQRIELPEVSARIQPETATLNAEGVEIVEQNFDFDLLTPSKMMEKAVGSRVRIVRTNPATGRETIETAEVLSANEGVVLKIGDRIEVLRDDGLPVRVLFDGIPENLRARPTLSVTLDSTSRGARPATLRYLTYGLEWSADYVGVFDEAKGALDLQGWVTLTNTSGARYDLAKTQLIAGSPGERAPRPIRAALRGGKGGAGGDDTAFGDYHLYTLPEPTTIAENQTKQVSFLDANDAQARKVYLVERAGFASQRYAEGAQVKLLLENSESTGLGEPLPQGTVRLYVRDSQGRPQFIGEDGVGHLAIGSSIELDVGSAFDVTAQSTIESRRVPVRGITETQMQIVFRNARAEPVEIAYTQSGLDPTHEFLAQSAPATKIDATTYGWTVAVPARGETILTFKVKEGVEERDDR